jgi:predicted enzyme related to lactoylglutathione lyase
MKKKGSAGAGRFVWHELITGNIDEAADFYGPLFGWEFKDVYRGDAGMVRTFSVDGRDAGSIRNPEIPGDFPPHWLPFVTVEDVGLGAAAAERLGGQVLSPPGLVPGFGESATVEDAGGARIGLLAADGIDDLPADAPPGPGHFIWNDLLAREPKKAGEFYCGVFGWQFYSMDMGEGGIYYLLRRDEINEGGIVLKPDQAEGSSMWLPYVAVPDCDSACVQAAHQGGSVFVPPSDLHGAGRYAVAGDRARALIALFEPGPAVTGAGD